MEDKVSINKMKEGKVIFKVQSFFSDMKEGLLKKDDLFWGGYKVECENSIFSINLVKDIEYAN